MRARPVSRGVLEPTHTGLRELVVNFLGIFARCLTSYRQLDMIHGRRLYSTGISGLTNQGLLFSSRELIVKCLPIHHCLCPYFLLNPSKWWMMLCTTPSHCSPAVSQALPPVGKEKKPLPEAPLMSLCMPKHPMAGFINFISLARSSCQTYHRPKDGSCWAPRTRTNV